MAGPSVQKGKSRTQISAETKVKQAKALKLRALRYSWDRIAQECGYASKGAAHTAVKNALAAIPAEAAKELREVELQSLEIAQNALARQIAQGHLGAIDRMIRLMDHRAKLTGLYEVQSDNGTAEVKAVLAAWVAQVQATDAEGEKS